MNKDLSWKDQCALVLPRDDVESIINAGGAPPVVDSSWGLGPAGALSPGLRPVKEGGLSLGMGRGL
jgi:hypothetical protein